MFQFDPQLVAKKETTPRASTPRNVVFPDTGNGETPSQIDLPGDPDRHGDRDEDAAAVAMDTATPRHQRRPRESGLPPSARKYLTSPQDPVRNEEELSTGLSSPRPGDPSARRRGPSGAPSRRTLRGSIHRLRHESVLLTKALVRSSRHLYRQLSLQQLLAYLLILFGLLSESFTPAPRYNVPVGILLFMNSPSSSDMDHRVVVTGLCGTTLLDFVWLLRPQEGSFNGYFRVQIENATHLCLAVCAAIKLWLIFSTYFDLEPEVSATEALPTPPPLAGSGLRARLWSRLKFLLPRKTLPRRSHLSYEVLMRVLVLIWIHGVCGVVLLLLGLLSVMGLSGKPVFRSASLGLSLPLAMLFKSASTLLSYVLATHDMSYHGCFKVSGCDALARFHEDSASEIVLKYNAKWAGRVKHAKVVDALLGVYLAAVYYSAVRSTTFITGDTVVAVLVLTMVILLVLDVWTPLLIMVVARCGSVLHTHHRNGTEEVDAYFPNQLEWEDDDDQPTGRSKRGESSSSGGSDDSSEEGSSSSLSDSASGHSSSSSTKRRRRQAAQSLRHSTSQRPLIPPPLKRANSMVIVDANALGDDQQLTNNGKPYWVRYWDNASGRSYLVHSVTNETIWEIGTAVQSDTIKHTPRVFASASSFPPTRSARESARGSARASSHPTSESDVLVTTGVRSPSPAVLASPTSSRRSSKALLSAEDFLLLWDTQPDGGSFTCRVSKVPTAAELRQHLHSHGFTVASDGLNVSSVRTIHFFSLVGDDPANNTTRSGRRLSLGRPVSFFLGEFLVDSLSLKLYAKFRCQEVDAIVPFVKKLQLKEIVGAYAPCD